VNPQEITMVKKYEADSNGVKSGKRLKQVLKAGVALQKKIEELQQKKADLEAELLGIVATFDDRGKTDDIELTAGPDVPGKVSVTWGTDYQVDPKKAEMLRKQMGDTEFFRCFTVKTSYSRARSQSTWLKEAHGALDKFKTAIEKAVTKVVRSKPTVKWQAL
jgi:hypothetical protein